MPRHSLRRVDGVIRKVFRQKKYFDIERETLETLYPHPFISEIINSFEIDYPNYNGVISLPDYGTCDLYNWVHTFEYETSLEITCTILKKVVLALQYASLFNIKHRDIKLENIMIDKTGIVKLIDWELCTSRQYSREKVGTLGYMAPEVLTGKCYNCSQSDMWSLGVAFFALYYGRRPYDDVPQKAKYTSSKEWYCPWLRSIEMDDWENFWENHERINPEKEISNSFKQCIQGLLTYDPDKRTSLEELMENELLNKPLVPRKILKERALVTISV